MSNCRPYEQSEFANRSRVQSDEEAIRFEFQSYLNPIIAEMALHGPVNIGNYSMLLNPVADIHSVEEQSLQNINDGQWAHTHQYNEALVA